MFSNGMTHRNVFIFGNRMFTSCANVFQHLMTRLHKDTKKHETLPFSVKQSEPTGNEIAMAVPFEMANVDTSLTSMNALWHYSEFFMGRHINNGKMISYIRYSLSNKCCIGSFTAFIYC